MTLLRPLEIVHYVVYSSGFHILCYSPWVVTSTVYQARVVTEVDSLGRTMTICLTGDPVDCMTCLVACGW